LYHPSLVFTTDFCSTHSKGQGPYFGQATWFARFHTEKLKSAIDRYVDEIFRVTEVLNSALEKNNTGWLVGNKLTYADISFITWASVGKGLLRQLNKESGLEEKYPKYIAWIKAMESRDTIKKIQDCMAKGRAANGL
jgi:glutathione S-transferase